MNITCIKCGTENLDYYISVVADDNRFQYEKEFMKKMSAAFWEEFKNVKFFHEDVVYPEKTKYLCSVIKKCGIFDEDIQRNREFVLKLMKGSWGAYNMYVNMVFPK